MIKSFQYSMYYHVRLPTIPNVRKPLIRAVGNYVTSWPRTIKTILVIWKKELRFQMIQLARAHSMCASSIRKNYKYWGIEGVELNENRCKFKIRVGMPLVHLPSWHSLILRSHEPDVKTSVDIEHLRGGIQESSRVELTWKGGRIG